MSQIIILHGTVTKHFIAAVKAVYPLVFMPIHAGLFSQVYGQRRAVSWNYLLWDVVHNWQQSTLHALQTIHFTLHLNQIL